MPQVFGDLNSRRSAIQGTENRARQQRHPRRSSARSDVRLCNRLAQPHTGTRHIHDALFALRGIAAGAGGGSH